jgi:hypothetical protein
VQKVARVIEDDIADRIGLFSGLFFVSWLFYSEN